MTPYKEALLELRRPYIAEVFPTDYRLVLCYPEEIQKAIEKKEKAKSSYTNHYKNI